MEEGTSRKRQREEEEEQCGYEAEPEVALEFNNSDVDQERQDMMAWLTDLGEDAFTELFDLLDSTSFPGHPVKFIDDPYSSLVIFQSSSAFVTINGNEESCGSSFSDLDSSVMASVDTSGVRGLVRRLSAELNVDGGGAEEEEDEEGAARGWWLEEKDFLEGIFAKSLSGCDLLGTPPPSGCDNDENDPDGGGGAEDEMCVNFGGDDLFDGSW